MICLAYIGLELDDNRSKLLGAYHSTLLYDGFPYRISSLRSAQSYNCRYFHGPNQTVIAPKMRQRLGQFRRYTPESLESGCLANGSTGFSSCSFPQKQQGLCSQCGHLSAKLTFASSYAFLYPLNVRGRLCHISQSVQL